MLSATLAIVTTTALCLAFPEVRWIGVLGAGLLAYLHPLLLLLSAVVAALFAVLHFHHKRRFVDGQATDDPRGD